MSFLQPANLVLIGLSHEHSPVEVRELCSVGPDEVVSRLEELRGSGHAGESWILSTCNRTEILVVTEDPDATEGLLAERFFKGLPANNSDQVYRHRGIEAVFHLFRVASGLESQVLGESEILGQMKRATELARAASSCGRMLQPLQRQALEVGKRVRSETKLGEGTLSIARAAVDLAHKVFGSFDRVEALIVGAGETGLLVAHHLQDSGIKRLKFANRTRSRAEEAATKFGGGVVAFEDLADGVSTANLVLVSVDAPEPVITMEHIQAARLKRRDRPVVMMDLSIPRAIHPDVRASRLVMVQDLDALDDIVRKNRGERQREIDAADHIVVQEVHKFLSLRAYDALGPMIAGLADAFEQGRADVVESYPELEGAEAFSSKLTRRLLDIVFGKLKQGTRKTHSTDAVSSEYQKFLERR